MYANAAIERCPLAGAAEMHRVHRASSSQRAPALNSPRSIAERELQRRAGPRVKERGYFQAVVTVRHFNPSRLTSFRHSCDAARGFYIPTCSFSLYLSRAFHPLYYNTRYVNGQLIYTRRHANAINVGANIIRLRKAVRMFRRSKRNSMDNRHNSGKGCRRWYRNGGASPLCRISGLTSHV